MLAVSNCDVVLSSSNVESLKPPPIQQKLRLCKSKIDCASIYHNVQHRIVIHSDPIIQSPQETTDHVAINDNDHL